MTLFGITIGIFLIILTQTAADFLKSSIDDTINTLGVNTVYVQKFPWSFDSNYPWWEYNKRPKVTYEDFESLRDNMTTAEATGYYTIFVSRALKNDGVSLSNVVIFGCSPGAEQAGSVKLKYGRFYTEAESKGSKVAVIGETLAAELFPNIEDPVGESFRLDGRKFFVIGVIASDDNFLGGAEWDETLIIPYTVGVSMYSIKGILDQWVVIKSKDDVEAERFDDDIIKSMRGSRRLRPVEDNNFAINKVTFFLEAVKGVKGTLDVTSVFLGIFALLIGGFGVANIMFVSVRERTKYIGLKKALGAKKWIILSEFLIESIILCLLGCAIGLTILWLIVFIGSKALDIDVALSLKNIVVGVVISMIIGLVSGLIPAIIGANMNPVKAIRT